MWRLAGLAIVAMVMLGCGANTPELEGDQDQQLRDNLTRPLTAEEVSQMGGAATGGAAEAPQRN